MLTFKKVSLILTLSLSQGFALKAWSAFADTEETRLRGFAEHQSENAQFDKARAGGERAQLETVEQWDRQRDREAEAYKHNRKQKEMTEEGPEALADDAEKKQLAKQYEASRVEYNQERSREKTLSREQKHLISEAKELGLDEERPRYDFRKRMSAKAGKGSSGAPSFGGGTSSGTPFPPPPTFDDFGGSGGFIPAPNMPEDFGDIPPPPPPPPPPGFGEDPGFGGTPFNPDFAPPPPPPPGFGGDSDF